MSFLSLDRSQKDSRLTVFLTEGKRVFYVSILSLVRSGNGFASGHLSYRQASTYRPRTTYYVTVLVFVCMYVWTTLVALPEQYSISFQDKHAELVCILVSIKLRIGNYMDSGH